jgi:hypothetical protein
VKGLTVVITPNSAAFQPNDVSSSEEKLIGATDYDASAVPDDAKQNPFFHYVIGITDPKKIPPYHNAAMQARVDRVGNSLIPDFQRSLPDTDPRKIQFRFQLVDGKSGRMPYLLRAESFSYPGRSSSVFRKTRNWQPCSQTISLRLSKNRPTA